jgi:MFS family permease
MADADQPALSSAAPLGGGNGAGGGLRFLLRAFRSRNYRLYFFGQLISMMGTWLTIVATSWLVYRLAKVSMPQKEAMILGLVNFSAQIPIFCLAPFGGVWVDRLNTHRILIVTQTLSMLQSFALAFFALRGTITILDVILLQLFQGMINALDVPARQSFVVDLVESREDLPNAIALSSSIVHAARLIGPAIGGYLIYALHNEGWCFLIDGVSYLAVLGALLAMRVKVRQKKHGGQRVLHAFLEGFRYSFGFPPIRSILALVALTSLMVMPLSTLMPIYADQVLGGRERVYGMLLVASGVGAFTGTMYLAWRKNVLGLGRVIAIANASLGMGMVAFSLSRTLWLSIPILFVTGGSLVVQMAAANTVLQTIVEDRMRGRVMSIFSMCFMGITPFGSILAGYVATGVGPTRTLMFAGIACVVGGGIFAARLNAMRPLVRPIYVERGILPEVAEGVQSTAAAATTSQE